MVASPTITLDGLRRFVERICQENALTAEVQSLMIDNVERLGDIYGKNIDRKEALLILAKQIDVTQTGFVREPVGIQEFVESPEYMNQGLYVRPPIMEHLIKLFEDQDRYHVVVLGGAIGIGKNYFADMAVGYMLYRMSCLYSPQSYYGLAPGSSIVFSFQSKTLALARKVVFTQFSARLQSSPFFNKHFPFSSSYKAELKFAHGISIVPISGSDTSALGMNIYCFPKGQEYLLADGSLGVIGNNIDNKSSKKCLTIDELNCIMAAKYDGEVYSGESELVRLTFENGDTIECTPNHPFRGDNNEWVKAEDAEGHLLHFVDLQDMSEAGYLSDTAFEAGAQNIRERIQEHISPREIMRGEANKDSTESEWKDAESNLSCVSEEVSNDFLQTSAVSQHDSKAISREVSQCTHVQQRGKEIMVGKEPFSCSRTAQRSGIQDCSSERDSQSESLGTSGVETKDVEFYGEKQTQHICEKSLRELSGRTENPNEERLGKISCSTEETNTHLSMVSEQRGEADQSIFVDGDSDGVLVGQESIGLGIRTGEISLHGERSVASLHTRFSGSRSIFGSEEQISGESGREVSSKETINGNEVDSLNRHGNEISTSEYDIQLDGTDEKASIHVGGTRPTIRRIRCIKVGRISGKVPVYDVANVGTTHTFFAKTKSGFLITHNTAIIDEMNFMGRVRKSRLSQFTGEEEYDQAEKLYQTVEQRLKSRFRLLGKVPGKIFLISSSNYEGDFIDRKIEEAKTDPNIFVMKMAQWEALDSSRFCGKKFYVVVPTVTARGYITMEKIPSIEREGYDYTAEGQRLLTIPIEYHQEFTHDLDNSLRNCGGIALPKRGKFIESTSVDRAMSAYQKYFRTNNQIFKTDNIVYDEIDTKDISSLLNPSFIRVIQTAERFGAHIDLGYTGDAVGISIGTVVGLKDIGLKTVFDQESGRFKSEAQGHLPMYAIIGMLKIYPPMVGEIDLNFIRDLMLYIGDILKFQFITLDKFQSVSMMQTFRAKGFPSSFLSVDKTPEAYLEVKNSLKEGRVMFPQSDTLKEELDNLEQDREKGKVDHAVGKQKDMSDSVAGVIYNFSLRRKSYSGFIITEEGDTTTRSNLHVRRSITSRPSTGRVSIYEDAQKQLTTSRRFNQ